MLCSSLAGPYTKEEGILAYFEVRHGYAIREDWTTCSIRLDLPEVAGAQLDDGMGPGISITICLFRCWPMGRIRFTAKCNAQGKRSKVFSIGHDRGLSRECAQFNELRLGDELSRMGLKLAHRDYGLGRDPLFYLQSSLYLGV